MKVHKNARLPPRGRERIVRQVASGQTPEAAPQPRASTGEPFHSVLLRAESESSTHIRRV